MSKQAKNHMLVQITHWQQVGKPSLFKYISTWTQTIAKVQDNKPAVSVVCSSILEFFKFRASRGIKISPVWL